MSTTEQAIKQVAMAIITGEVRPLFVFREVRSIIDNNNQIMGK